MAKIELESLDPQLQAAIKKVTNLRPKRVIDHILAHGQVTTDELKAYGYDHPPRAARDVREAGVPLVTTRVPGPHGKKIASYTFGDPTDIENHKLAGRQVFPKRLRDDLYQSQHGQCAICNHAYDARYLQIDHRIPYEIAGEAASTSEPRHFMLLCGSCQRRKSWSCEHCPNWSQKSPTTCAACIWCEPESYTHVACEQIRTVTVTFTGSEVTAFDEVRRRLTQDELAAIVRRAILAPPLS